ncbi:DNA polymerase III subunit alpha [Streptomyces sp. NPDC058371]|uniref:DNA polymerase III subunit alpha n=1 Tax=Streptomyces sp. NPDC058371 TaxID=3346463 RepID=UPI00364D2369
MHTASGYSARYGASHPRDLVARAAERGMSALALTDRDCVTGAIRFVKACAAHGVRPILGVDLAVDAQAPADPDRRRRTPVRGGAHVVEPLLRVTLLAQTKEGWARLCRLVSAAHAAAAGGPPVLPLSSLAEHAGPGLVVLLGPMSEPVRALIAGRPDIAEQLLVPWRALFGEGLRLECVYYGLSGTGPGSLRLAARTLQLADRTGVAAVVTNAVRYADAAQYRLADVLDSARLLRPIDFRRPGRLDPGERWLKGPAAMAEVAGQIADAVGAGAQRADRLLAETAATAASCTLDPVADLQLGQPHFPEPEVIGAGGGAGEADRLLRERCEAGLIQRGLGRDPAARERMGEELAVISQLGYATYFLTVATIVADVREMGIRVAARGSGAGSMVNHLLHIATANPLDHHLLMERFLSVRRTSLPDIDIDVESARRLEVYDKIFDRFGAERVAVTGMPETYRARHALRDTGLALGIAPQEVDRVAKAFPHIRACDIRAALGELPELKKLAAEAGRFGILFELAEGLDALPRGMAMHPCGVILSNSSLLDRLPVQPTPGGAYPMVHADKEDVELDGGFGFGLVKLDVLGVRMQSAMAHAVTEIEQATSRRIDLDDPKQVPLDDYFAFKLIQDSRTIGLFQLESSGQQDLLSRLQPRDVQDVIADISLFRPGPVAGGMPEQYIAARHGATPVYPHPDLEPVLRDTYAVVIWHEQIIDMISVLTGCDRALAELARRALSDAERLPKLRAWFLAKATNRGYDLAMLSGVWETIEAFGAYGFCRAHAVAFAVPALQSAWLKAHFPAALYAGLLEHDPGMWSKRIIVADARRHGVPVLGVDINHSRPHHTIEQTDDGTFGVRLALSAVKNISEADITRIADHQPYTSLQDLWHRARPARPTAERLVQIGALDALRGTQTRRDLLLQVTELHRHARTRTTTGQLPIDHGQDHTPAPSGLPEMTSRQALGAELEHLQIDVTQHLMDHHHQLLRELGAVPAAHLARLHPGQQVLVAGVRASTQTPPIASGKRIIFVTLEDGTGMTDLAFFEDSHDTCAHTIFHSGLLLVRGQIQRRGRRNTLTGQRVWDLDELAAARRDHGPEAVTRFLGDDLPPATRPARPRPQRTLPVETGATLHPWADLQPAGTRSADLTKLGHTSPGSAG